TKLYSILGLRNLLIDVFLSTLLIGFPTFLMGGTLPLLTQGLSRDLDEASQTHARIYGFNTLGACFGCLLACYVLIPSLGLCMATPIAGCLNFIVAIVVHRFFAGSAASVKPASEGKHRAPFTRPQQALLAIGFLSGFYLITLQTILIRLMGLSTGAA